MESLGRAGSHSPSGLCGRTQVKRTNPGKVWFGAVTCVSVLRERAEARSRQIPVSDGMAAGACQRAGTELFVGKHFSHAV
jgi:hypothetical protein